MIAAAKDSSRQPTRASEKSYILCRRAFTALSERLGSLALALHASLFEATRQETLPAAPLAALTSLLRAAPYARLPADLLPQTLQVPGGSTIQRHVSVSSKSVLRSGLGSV